MNQPPIDNAHVAAGCEPFTSAADYQPTDPMRLAIRRGLTKFASSDAKLCDVENEIVAVIDAERSEAVTAAHRVLGLWGSQYICGNSDAGRAMHAMQQLAKASGFTKPLAQTAI